MRTVTGPEGVVYIGIGQRAKLICESRVVLGLAFVESKVLQKGYANVRNRSEIRDQRNITGQCRR